MNALTIFLIIPLFVVSCGKSNDGRLAKLEKRVDEIEAKQSEAVDLMVRITAQVEKDNISNSNEWQHLNQLTLEQNSNILQVVKAFKTLKEPAANTPPDISSVIDSATGQIIPAKTLPSQSIIDPATGNFYPPRVVRASNRVVEQNSVYWRWGFNFSIANPTPNRAKLDVIARFYDADHFVLDEKNLYDLSVQPFFTNTFSDYKLVDADKAPRVKFFDIKIKE